MKAFSKIEITIVLLLGIAVMLQFYINYIDVSQPQSLSTKFGSVFNYHAKFFGNNFKKKSFEKIGEKLSA